MRKFIHIILLFLFVGFMSCEEYFEPRIDNTYDEEILMSRPQYVEGLLMHAYINLPSNYNFYTDVATDDAVTNLVNSSYSRLATGEWSSAFNPISAWASSYAEIFYVNKFLELYESVTWASDQRLEEEDNEIRNQNHKKRLRGEAHGLRAWYKFQLLKGHSGIATDGQLLGFPLIDTNIDISDDWRLPRNTFDECVNSIISDLDVAIANLPPAYTNVGDFNIDNAFGARFHNRMSGNAAKALKSRVTLFAASPAFSESGDITWVEAAKVSGDLLVELGGLFAGGIKFYSTTDNKEKIWNRSLTQTRTWEASNFPPSLYGLGRTNPTQNLVDAFPMKNGYPIDHALSNYSPGNPYANRDSRLTDYIIYNKASLKSKPINTYEDAVSDGIGELESSTRTGYYLKKLMSESVNLVPGSTTNAAHTYTFFRETEVHLNFAEAANEAWGPDGDPNAYGFSAKSIIGNIRKRAGISQPDAYLSGITTKEGMRSLIRNERRLELCFEDFRFWDIRRWNDIATMKAPAKGVYITFNSSDGSYSYRYDDIENRNFSDYMIYGPIPLDETLKYDIKQNSGW